MIKALTVTNYVGDTLRLELAHPEKSPFAVTKIDGLGPGKANINTTEVSTTDGGLYNSARVPVRNIVISLRYLWRDTIEDARQLSYKYFPIKKPLKLVIETDNRVLQIEGYTEANEPDIFSKESGTDISIVCPSPFFYSSTIEQTVFSGIEPMFEFPFSNESTTEDLLEMGYIRQYKERVIVYGGDAETGVTITIHALGPASNITIYNIGTRETMTVDTDKLISFTGQGITAGDDIVICTEQGKKSVLLVREGITTNILNCLDKNTDWFKLSKGENIFAYTADTGANNLQFSITNHIVYEGI